MWGPVEELRKMSKNERLGYLSFTSDDMTEQIVSYLIEQNKRLQNKCNFFRNKVRAQASQIERMSEKLRTTGLTNEGT